VATSPALTSAGRVLVAVDAKLAGHRAQRQRGPVFRMCSPSALTRRWRGATPHARRATRAPVRKEGCSPGAELERGSTAPKDRLTLAILEETLRKAGG
jgi:hypothetical protein